MKLYSLPLSPFAARARGAIYAKNLPIEIALPPEGWRTSEEFQKLNPLKRIPILVLDDGSGLAESGVIVEYLEDKFPTLSLRSASPEACARMRFLIQVADIYLMQAILPLFHLFDAKERDMAAIEQQLGKLEIGFTQVNDLLADNTYADGDRLSLADIWLTPIRFTIDGLMGFSGRKGLLDRYKRLAGYRDVIDGDPTLKRVWQEMEEGLKAFMASRAEAAKAS